MIRATIDETKRRGDELFELRARVEWLETGRAMQHKAQVGEAPGIQTPGRSSQEPAVSQDNGFGIFM